MTIWQRLQCRFGFHQPSTEPIEYRTIYLAHFRIWRCTRCRKSTNWQDTDTGAYYRNLDQFLMERYD